MLCHKCKFNGKGNEVCLSCHGDWDDYEIKRFHTYLDESFENVPAKEIDENESYATHLNHEDEEKLRLAMCSLFSLKPLELLML